MRRTVALIALALGLAGAAAWSDRGVRTGWFTLEGPSPESPAWEDALRRLEQADARHERALRRLRAGPKKATLGESGRWPLYWSLRATAAPELEKARARFVADVEKLRVRHPDEGVLDALLAVAELDQAGLYGRDDPIRGEARERLGPAIPVLGDAGAARLRRATVLLEQAVARPRLDLGDVAAIRSALALPQGTPTEAWERKGAVEQARRAGSPAGTLLRASAAHGAALARAHATVAPDEAARLLLALRRLGLRLGAEALSTSAGSNASAIVTAADEGLVAITARGEQGWLAARDELDLLRTLDRDALLTEIPVDLPVVVVPDLMLSTPDERAFRRLNDDLMRAFLVRLALLAIAGCAVAVAIGQLGGSLSLRWRPAPRPAARLLAPAPWTLRDDLHVALGSFGVAAALAVLFMRAGPLRIAEEDDLLRLAAMMLGLMGWPAVASHVLLRGRLLAKHRRTWREPARVHLGLALGLAGLVLVVAPFDGLLGVAAGCGAALVGVVIACTGGAEGERDPALEHAFVLESQGPLLRAVALGAALVCAADLLHVAPWRTDLMERYARAGVVRLERAPEVRRDGLEALRRTSADAPRTHEERRGS